MISANGRFGNPDQATLDMLPRVRTDDDWVLHLTNGAAPNHVSVSGAETPADAELAPGQPLSVTVRFDERGSARLRIATSSGFVPAEVIPGSEDRRFLGVSLFQDLAVIPLMLLVPAFAAAVTIVLRLGFGHHPLDRVLAVLTPLVLVEEHAAAIGASLARQLLDTTWTPTALVADGAADAAP